MAPVRKLWTGAKTPVDGFHVPVLPEPLTSENPLTPGENCPTKVSDRESVVVSINVKLKLKVSPVLNSEP